MKFDYLFSEVMPFQIGDEVLPGMTVKKIIRCINCLLPDRFLDSIYCTEKRYWIEEDCNQIIPHCALMEIPESEKNYLTCEEDCENTECDKECIGRK